MVPYNWRLALHGRWLMIREALKHRDGLGDWEWGDNPAQGRLYTGDLPGDERVYVSHDLIV